MTSAAKQNLKKNGYKLWHAKLVAKGQHEAADAYAKKMGIGKYDPAAAPAPVAQPVVAVVETPSAPQPDAPDGMVRIGNTLWPQESDATIFKFCLNKRVIMIQLADGRKSLMWNNPRQRLLLKMKCRVKLTDPHPDPIYSYVKVPTHGFVTMPA